jgi:hypothetical protein
MNLQFDTEALVTYTKKLNKAQKVTTPAISASLNIVGDQLVQTIVNNAASKTGLGIDVVRRALRVERSTRGSLAYTIHLDETLFENRQRRLQAEAEREAAQAEKKKYGKFKPGEMVIVKTQDDELVCMDCEELGAAGPIPIDVALEHIPKHPNCRCVIMPYVPRGKRLPVTMTTISGTDPGRRAGMEINESATLRQLAQEILNRTTSQVRVELK